VLPLSHDEVVHGKGSMFGRMPGDEWQKFAGLRNLYGYLWATRERSCCSWAASSPRWRSGTRPQPGLAPAGACRPPRDSRLVRDLNNVYRHFPALYELDTERAGFEWIVHDDAGPVGVRLCAQARDGSFVVAVCNFTPLPRHGYRLGVPAAGAYREAINTDGAVYGGSGVGNGVVQSAPVPWHGKADSIVISVPPLATVMWVLV
jgi:1,4-alpha-glucan branching enzyme